MAEKKISTKKLYSTYIYIGSHDKYKHNINITT